MDDLIELLQSIKDEVKSVKGCTIVAEKNDEYTHILITNDNHGGVFVEEIP